MRTAPVILNTNRMRFPIVIILVCIRWYAAYPLRYRHLEEMMQEHGVKVDHSTIYRWVIRFLPLLELAFRQYKRLVGGSWRMDETYVKEKGAWTYLYRAVDKDRKTIDFLLTEKRDMAAAKRFFDKALQSSGTPESVTMDKSGANKAAIDAINTGKDVLVKTVFEMSAFAKQPNYLAVGSKRPTWKQNIHRLQNETKDQ